jgi:hypothetical protein
MAQADSRDAERVLSQGKQPPPWHEHWRFPALSTS